MGNFTQPSSNRSYSRGALRMEADGSFTCDVAVTNDAGRTVDNITVRVPVAGPIIDRNGDQLAAAVPAGVISGRSAFISAVDAAIDAAAAAGKFNR